MRPWHRWFSLGRLKPADLTKVNPNGGAIAIDHPLGSSGTSLVAALPNELERTDGRFGWQVMRQGDGTAHTALIERSRY
jgi:acetyl-CoA acetyltransferase